MENKVKVLSGQTLFDIAIQECGSCEYAFDIAVLNELNITDDLFVNQELIISTTKILEVTMYLKRRLLKPATAITQNQEYTGIFDRTFDLIFA